MTLLRHEARMALTVLCHEALSGPDQHDDTLYSAVNAIISVCYKHVLPSLQ